LLNIIGKRYWYFLLSALVIVPGAISLGINGLKLGPDFTGGSEIEVQIAKANQSIQLDSLMRRIGAPPEFVQPVLGTHCPTDCRYFIRSKLLSQKQQSIFTKELKTQYPGNKTQVLDIKQVSGTVASDTTKNAFIAVAAASVAILLYITFAFRRMSHPFRYGTAAIAAMLHDVLVVTGIFSILGATLNVEIDATFVTAMLTIIGFSVHDTIVIFDRIRENVSRHIGEPFEEIVNHSLLQTFVRSINTSFTVVLTLGAIFLFSGESIRYFVLAMLIGIISGTYSSIFNASPILVVWHNGELKRLFSRGARAGEGKPAAA
jgi:preprotein translocase subunit SecF